MSFCVEVWLNSIEFKLDLVERMSWVERFNTIEVYQKSMDGIPRSWETSPFWILHETIAAESETLEVFWRNLKFKPTLCTQQERKWLLLTTSINKTHHAIGTCRRPSRAGPVYKQNLLSYKLLLSGTFFFLYIKCNVVVMNWCRRRETESHRKDVVWTRSSVPSSCESVKIFLIKGHLNPKSLVYSHLKAKFSVHKISSQSFEQVISSCKERLLTILFLTYTGILLSHHLL